MNSILLIISGIMIATVISMILYSLYLIAEVKPTTLSQIINNKEYQGLSNILVYIALFPASLIVKCIHLFSKYYNQNK